MGIIRRKQLLALILAMDKDDKRTYPVYFQVEGDGGKRGMVTFRRGRDLSLTMTPDARQKFFSPFWRSIRSTMMDVWYADDTIVDFAICSDRYDVLLYGLKYYYGITDKSDIRIITKKEYQQCQTLNH
jgi:hypothetical protein